MNRVVKLIATIFFLSSGMVMAQPDSLVTYTGTVVNLRTENPIPGIQVSYKKLPYESEMGDLKTDANGQFTVYFRAREEYSFSIEGEGFIKVSEIINPLEGADEQLVVTRNLNLSQMRVDEVKKYLVEKGVAQERVETKAFGGSQPLVRSNSSQERAVNRRVEVRILSDGSN